MIQKSFMLYILPYIHRWDEAASGPVPFNERTKGNKRNWYKYLPFLQMDGLKPDFCVFVLILQLPWLIEVLMVQDSGVGGWLL